MVPGDGADPLAEVGGDVGRGGALDHARQVSRSSHPAARGAGPGSRSSSRPSRASTRLAFALEALAQQTLPATDFEVVVARAEGARGPLAEAPEGIAVRFVTASERGPVPQRNLGWREARGSLVAFIDDDCRPHPGWLERLVAPAEGKGEGAMFVVQGRTEPDPDELHLLIGLARTIEITGPSGLYETCNLLYPKAVLERLGGFADEFRLPHWGEDTDLGLRAEEAARGWSMPTTRSPGTPSTRTRCRRRCARRAGAAGSLAWSSRHPRLRKHMPAGVFVNRPHALVAGAAVGLVASRTLPRRRTALTVLALLPYVAHNVDQFLAQGGPLTPRRVARFATHLPARAAVDVAETTATVRGALETRTLVI